MPVPFLLNPDGTSFDPNQLGAVGTALNALNNAERTAYRNQNAKAIAEHDCAKSLIVSGPGTGKSHLFLERIKFWLSQNPKAQVLVTSFVRKLVADLQSDIANSTDLTDEHKQQVKVLTLHKLARSFVERSHGTANWQLAPYFQIVGQSWKSVVWQDVLAFHTALNAKTFSREVFERALHDGDFPSADNWKEVSDTYLNLTQFYNAVGFADLILHAKTALAENPDLIEEQYFIVDEYQDFNLAEEIFINQLVANSVSLLIVGDDDQVLYEGLKASKQDFIRARYADGSFVKAMLPFCGRSGFHITMAAAHFIQSRRDANSIEKLYLPISVDTTTPKVRLVACATPATAVDYVQKFITDHKAEIDQRKQDLADGKAKDAYVLLLAQSKDLRFYGDDGDALKKIAAAYQVELRSYSEDYYLLLTFYSLAKNPRNNFTFRKVLHYQGVSNQRVHELVAGALEHACGFCDLAEEEITSALALCNEIRAIIDSHDEPSRKGERLAALLELGSVQQLVSEIKPAADSEQEVARLEHEEEEEAELGELEVQRMGAVELMTIVGSKGLSADQVLILGFDDVNLKYVTANAFFVALTRARKTVHLITALQSAGAKAAHAFIDNLPAQNIEFYCYKKTGHVLEGKGSLTEFKKYFSGIEYAKKISVEKARLAAAKKAKEK